MPRAGNIPLSQGLQGREKAIFGGERDMKAVSGEEDRKIGITEAYGCCQNGKRSQACYLFIVRRKKTFLMFFGSSQAISPLPHLPISPFSVLQKRRITEHRFPQRHPAVTFDYTQQHQTPSMPCTAQWCEVPMTSGGPPQR